MPFTRRVCRGGARIGVELALLSGHEEEMLAVRGPGARHSSPHLESLAPPREHSPVPAELVRRLLVADRQYLLPGYGPSPLGTRSRPPPAVPGRVRKKVDIDFSSGYCPGSGATLHHATLARAAFKNVGRGVPRSPSASQWRDQRCDALVADDAARARHAARALFHP